MIIYKIDAKVPDYWLIWLCFLRFELDNILQVIKSIDGNMLKNAFRENVGLQF